MRSKSIILLNTAIYSKYGIFIHTISILFSILIPIFIYLVYLINDKQKCESWSKKCVITIFKPFLHKKVVHESGIFYVYHDDNKKKYFLYKDNLLYRVIFSNIEERNIRNSNDIIKWVKGSLDNHYYSKMAKQEEKKSKKEILSKWDGYTSDSIKRDDKINKII